MKPMDALDGRLAFVIFLASSTCISGKHSRNNHIGHGCPIMKLVDALVNLYLILKENVKEALCKLGTKLTVTR